MKYKLISTILIGVLAAGLYAEAVTAPAGMAEAGYTAEAEDTAGANDSGEAADMAGANDTAEAEGTAGANDSGEAADMAGANDTAEAEAAAGGNDTPAAGGLSGAEDLTDAEGPLPCMAGGIWADLRPEETMPTVQTDLEAASGQEADPAGSEGIVPEAETGAVEAEGSDMENNASQSEAGAESNAPESGDAGAEPESEYADLAIAANVNSFVNVRSGPSTDSTIVGKIGSGAVAQVLETVPGEDGDWFRVVSGKVEGYMKAEYFLYGEAAAEVIDNYVTRYAVVLASRLNIRQEPDVETKRIGYIDKEEKVEILENLGDWLRVQYTDSKTGYVAAEYVTVAEEFVYAKTLEEIEAEQAARKALEQRQNVSETQAAEDTVIAVTPPSGNYSTNEELRAEIVAYAMQFLGNRYVHGGQSLETGTDCSGFTSLIYAQFGYSVSRTPAGQLSGAGKSISYSEAQPGDIICYGSRRCTHVALYIGDGQIIHAANSRKGVVTQRADYDNILGVKNLIDP